VCVVGSELIQKYLGDGSKLFMELFRAPILTLLVDFIDEIDTYGTKRYDDVNSGREIEIQRTASELLNRWT
ncbi:unnamed protein product, partial [Musa hybrid cultivar]